MPKNLTETAGFDTPITVPLGTDLRDHAADDVELIAQRLANRTAHLKALIEALSAIDFARRDADNTFSANNTFQRTVTSSVGAGNDDPVLDVTVAADINTNNKWRRVAKLRTSNANDVCVHVYTSSDSSSRGVFAITYNAHWRTSPTGGYPAGHWTTDSGGNSTPSIAMIFNGDSVRIAVKSAGAGDWSEWQDGSNLTALLGILEVSKVEAQTLRAANFLFRSTLNRTTPLPTTHFGGGRYGWYNESQNLVQFNSDGTNSSDELAISWPLVLPPGATLKNVFVRHRQHITGGGSVPSSARNTFRVWRRDQIDFGWTEVTASGGVRDPSGTAGDVTTQLFASDLNAFINAGHEWLVTWYPSTDSDPVILIDNGVLGINLEWSAPGLLI